MAEPSTIWNETVLEKLTEITREKKFNFEAAAAEMIVYCSSVDTNIPVDTITAHECRRQFSASYLGMPEPAACDARKSSSNKAVEKFLSTEFSFDQAMEFVNQLQLDSLSRQEEVFRRVLDTLDSTGTDRKSAAEISSGHEVGEDILAAWRARKAKEEEGRVQAQKARAAREEQAALEAQRHRLARRFEADSEDAEGINPLEHLDNANSSSSSSSSSNSNGGAAVASEGIIPFGESKQVLQPGHPIYSVPETDQDAYLTQHFKMNDFVNSDEFNSILESLEAELDAQAQAKKKSGTGRGGKKTQAHGQVGGEMDDEEVEEEEEEESELGEILKYLDSCDNIPNAGRGAGADDVIPDPSDVSEVFMQNALSNMQNISNMKAAISANANAKRAMSAAQNNSNNNNSNDSNSAVADKKSLTSLQLPVPAGIASVIVPESSSRVLPPQPPPVVTAAAHPTAPAVVAPTTAPPRSRRVIETILDDSDDSSAEEEEEEELEQDEQEEQTEGQGQGRNRSKDSRAAQQRKWRDSRSKLKSGADAAKAEAEASGATASSVSNEQVVWGGGGASTRDTAAGLQQRQIVSKCKSFRFRCLRLLYSCLSLYLYASSYVCACVRFCITIS